VRGLDWQSWTGEEWCRAIVDRERMMQGNRGQMGVNDAEQSWTDGQMERMIFVNRGQMGDNDLCQSWTGKEWCRAIVDRWKEWFMSIVDKRRLIFSNTYFTDIFCVWNIFSQFFFWKTPILINTHFPMKNTPKHPYHQKHPFSHEKYTFHHQKHPFLYEKHPKTPIFLSITPIFLSKIAQNALKTAIIFVTSLSEYDQCLFVPLLYRNMQIYI
jgi:hypothetical protein